MWHGAWPRRCSSRASASSPRLYRGQLGVAWWDLRGPEIGGVGVQGLGLKGSRFVWRAWASAVHGVARLQHAGPRKVAGFVPSLIEGPANDQEPSKRSCRKRFARPPEPSPKPKVREPKEPERFAWAGHHQGGPRHHAHQHLPPGWLGGGFAHGSAVEDFRL